MAHHAALRVRSLQPGLRGDQRELRAVTGSNSDSIGETCAFTARSPIGAGYDRLVVDRVIQRSTSCWRSVTWRSVARTSSADGRTGRATTAATARRRCAAARLGVIAGERRRRIG
jgi:hypothetical protein